MFEFLTSSEQLEKGVLPGIYEHYKSTPEMSRNYLVIGCVPHTERDEILVIYTPLYTDEEEFCARPLEVFTEMVECDGEMVPRFRFVELDA